MKVIEILKSVGYNTPITDKRVLYALKRAGVIADYSPWGYLETQTLYYKDNDGVKDNIYTAHEEFCKCVKDGELGSWQKPYPSREAMMGDVNRHPTYKGIKLSYKYVDGCFCPYLVKEK